MSLFSKLASFISWLKSLDGEVPRRHSEFTRDGKYGYVANEDNLFHSKETIISICDICGKNLSAEYLNVISANPVVKATRSGYVPSKLPSSWYSQCKTLGISVGSHWNKVVDGNSSEDWGLCESCLKEVNDYR